MITMFTDGAAKGNPGPGGYGTILRYGDKEKELSEGFRMTTNNRMELMAVIAGLEAIKKPGWNVLVVSDSKYVVDAVTKGWLKSWVVKDFKGKKNRDLWERYLKASAPHDVRFQWVKGHAGHPENERCDQLAVEAAERKNLKVDAAFEANN
ncbi:MAG: ribonuclease HI [Ekhidna sp.]|uniref:ribonuclease HI n=1 Tax=Ekhidna sp. TaxID=2608089 RepID=UPI0032EDF229